VSFPICAGPLRCSAFDLISALSLIFSLRAERLDSDDFARALKRFLRLDLGHETMGCLVAMAERAAGGQLGFTPLDPPEGQGSGGVLEAAPFAPRGYFRRASTFLGVFAGCVPSAIVQ